MRAGAFGLVLLAALPLGACSTAEDYLASVNPFQRRDPALPGERRPAIGGEQRAAIPSDVRPVAVPGVGSVSDWLNPGGPPSHATGHAAFSGAGQGWRVPGTSSAGRAGSPPIVVGGRVIHYDNTQLRAFALEGGGQLWAVDPDPAGVERETTGGGVASDGTRAVVATGLRRVTAVDVATGGQLWSTQLLDPVRGAPTIANGRVHLMTGTSGIVALDLSTGREVWRWGGAPGGSSLVSAAAPAVTSGSLVAALPAGELVALDAARGTQRWMGSLARAGGASFGTLLADVAARPVVSNGIVYAGSVFGRFVAVREASGDRLWERPVSIAHSPVVTSEAVYLVTPDGVLEALDRANGSVRFAARLPQQGVPAGPGRCSRADGSGRSRPAARSSPSTRATARSGRSGSSRRAPCSRRSPPADASSSRRRAAA